MKTTINTDGKWEILKSEYLFKRPWLTVRKDCVQLPSGQVNDEFYVLEYPDWVNVIAITKDGQYVMERQYRHGLGVTCYEVCAGVVEAGEPPLEAAKRELLEETGYAGGEWEEIMTLCGNSSTTNNYTKQVYEALGYMQYAPLIFVSAKTGQRVTNIFEHICYVYNQSRMRISTGMLNDVLGDATTRVQPPSDKGRRLKIYYMTQIRTAPPTFVIFCNNAELFHYSYQRYIENCLRETFGFRGTPIKLIIREKGEEIPNA